MKNKMEWKKAFVISTIIIASFLIIFAILYQVQYQTYTKQFNIKLNSIIVKLQEEYPNLAVNDIMRILNNTDETEMNLLRQYGIDLKEDAILLKNDSTFQKSLLFNLALLGGFGVCLLFVFILFTLKFILFIILFPSMHFIIILHLYLFLILLIGDGIGENICISFSFVFSKFSYIAFVTPHSCNFIIITNINLYYIAKWWIFQYFP